VTNLKELFSLRKFTVLVVVGLALAAPSVANADVQVSRFIDGSVPEVWVGSVSATEPSGLRMTFAIDADGRLIVSDAGNPLTPGGVCSPVDSHTVDCGTDVAFFVVNGTAHPDVVRLSGLSYWRSLVTLRAGPDRFYGGSGADLVRGGFGQDSLFGGTGDDSLWGGEGSDYLAGGRGNDVLGGDWEPDAALWQLQRDQAAYTDTCLTRGDGGTAQGCEVIDHR
jgi:hypothetical protein